jgi:hypothetical protein
MRVCALGLGSRVGRSKSGSRARVLRVCFTAYKQIRYEICEGLPGVYSTIWCLCYKTNKLKKREKQKERRWACLHRLKKKGVDFVAGGGVERGSAGLSPFPHRTPLAH